ncbi:hypothetical protein L596_013545 [Steinernema carpocapsae]|uniref:Uncharacterized protein n=1 Tax=Steinernema carpocapsae TaxID=34508 RepID=A0A4V6A550_STECR|nr:hypothetical protein L596_013545 [Steinernema carpocapsae]
MQTSKLAVALFLALVVAVVESGKLPNPPIFTAVQHSRVFVICRQVSGVIKRLIGLTRSGFGKVPSEWTRKSEFGIILAMQPGFDLITFGLTLCVFCIY